jgi:AcrR family transcriptional regulator
MNRLITTNKRIERLKEQTKKSIFFAALKIIREEGCQGLSMRKIAQEIEYTAPAIYEYFANKEALIIELKKYGFLLLTKRVRLAASLATSPAEQIKSMWLAYWDFALLETELYHIMFGLDVHAFDDYKSNLDCEVISQLFQEVIERLTLVPDEETLKIKLFTYWSLVHGLLALQLTQDLNGSFSRKILLEGIEGISKSIHHKKI